MLTGSALPLPHAVRRRIVPANSTKQTALSSSGRLVWRTINNCIRFRVLGLAAETAFFLVLALPPLLFGLAGSIGYLARTFSVASVTAFRTEVLELAGKVLTQPAIDDVVGPTLNDVLRAGRVDVMSIGFVLSLWSGSRAMSVFVDTVTIMYGRRGIRGAIRAKVLSVGMYVLVLLLSAGILPLVLAGPAVIRRLLPHHLAGLAGLYWPIVLASSVLTLTTLYSWTVPSRRRWRADLPGAALTLTIWLVGSWLLRAFVAHSLGDASLYGPLAAPIALLMWLYVVSLAVLVGAALNAATETVWPGMARLDD